MSTAEALRRLLQPGELIAVLPSKEGDHVKTYETYGTLAGLVANEGKTVLWLDQYEDSLDGVSGRAALSAWNRKVGKILHGDTYPLEDLAVTLESLEDVDLIICEDSWSEVLGLVRSTAARLGIPAVHGSETDYGVEGLALTVKVSADCLVLPAS